MVRFSCFNSHIHSNKLKKTDQTSAEAMHKTLEDRSNKSRRNLNVQGVDALHANDDCITNSSSGDRDVKSEEIKGSYSMESEIGIHEASLMKKSQSLGSGLDKKGNMSNNCDGLVMEYETEQGFSCDESHDHIVPVSDKDSKISLPDKCQEPLPTYSVQVSSDMVNDHSIFSNADPQQSEKEGQDFQISSKLLLVMVKSSSSPNLASSGENSMFQYPLPSPKSSEDLTALLSSRHKEKKVIQKHESDRVVLNNGNSNCDAEYNYDGPAKDWIIPVNIHGESSTFQSEELPSKDFKLKRIMEWVTDLQHCGPLEETNEVTASKDDDRAKRSDAVLDVLNSTRLDDKTTAGMEAAKRYISSLSATATAAQLANHGLVVIPFMSAFMSLKALNLSGNAIVRITAGALPRGLHVLNLSKNKISTIEGLRELTRLRVLDLSYNRLVRIGHGLGSCSTLKELYLAGNKISEVEGLHRLLKLNVLDLRFNKISTTKCLGQLAANYNSLQAISLEGNPAQKNVGDDQIKKYLQGLLPHLAYYNRQAIKVGTLKDSSDRSTRLGIGNHPGLRSELKAMRKGGGHGVSSAHVSKSQAVSSSSRPSRDSRHGQLPPVGTTTHKGKPQRHQIYDIRSKILSLRPDLSMRRSRSEGTLGAL